MFIPCAVNLKPHNSNSLIYNGQILTAVVYRHVKQQQQTPTSLSPTFTSLSPLFVQNFFSLHHHHQKQGKERFFKFWTDFILRTKRAIQWGPLRKILFVISQVMVIENIVMTIGTVAWPLTLKGQMCCMTVAVVLIYRSHVNAFLMNFHLIFNTFFCLPPVR